MGRKKKVQAILQNERDREFVMLFLTRLANFPPNLILAAAVARPDGGVTNVIASTNDLRRLASVTLPELHRLLVPPFDIP